MLLLIACQTPTHIITTGEEDSPTESVADIPLESTPPVDTGPFPIASADGTPLAGYPPLTVAFEAAGSTSPTEEMIGSWSFDDGGTKEGLDVLYVFGDEGIWDATLTIDDGAGHTADDTVQVYVRSPDCPRTGDTEILGQTNDEELNEISGVVDSPLNDGILWVHNDAGDDPRLFALSYDGAIRSVVDLSIARGDLEDIGRGEVDGVPSLFVGDIGDNGRDNTAIWVHVVAEPTVDATQERTETELTPTATLTLTYPEGVAEDAESLFVDPVTGDLFIVTKDSSGISNVYTKAAPHSTSETELELVTTLDFSSEPLSGSLTTAATISPDGSQIIVRTYRQQAYLWERGEGSVGSAFAGVPCEINMPTEPQSESIGFSVDGTSLFTVSERTEVPINRTPLEARD
ncbi:MAG: hypothetical protein GY913_12745 [Proteobacteria bacterium]|nr:hypothetical protein [Pseudomonadota bacterium]MCP4917774.1 hypothetical protein [Pseudomonadota bacterium]